MYVSAKRHWGKLCHYWHCKSSIYGVFMVFVFFIFLFVLHKYIISDDFKMFQLICFSKFALLTFWVMGIKSHGKSKWCCCLIIIFTFFWRTLMYLQSGPAGRNTSIWLRVSDLTVKSVRLWIVIFHPFEKMVPSLWIFLILEFWLKRTIKSANIFEIHIELQPFAAFTILYSLQLFAGFKNTMHCPGRKKVQHFFKFTFFLSYSLYNIIFFVSFNNTIHCPGRKKRSLQWDKYFREDIWIHCFHWKFLNVFHE